MGFLPRREQLIGKRLGIIALNDAGAAVLRVRFAAVESERALAGNEEFAGHGSGVNETVAEKV